MSDEWSPRPKRRGTHVTRLPRTSESGYVYAPYIPIMKPVMLSVTKQRVVARPRKLKFNWTPELSQDLAEEHGMNKALPKDKPTEPRFKKHRNKLNGIEYVVVPKTTKFIDGVKYVKVLRTPFDEDATWVRADVLEPFTPK